MIDDYSDPAALSNYTVETPRGGGQAAMNVFVADEELVFDHVGGFGVAGAFYNSDLEIEYTSLSADVRFEPTPNQSTRSAAGLEWASDIQNRISAFIQYDQQDLMVDYVIAGVWNRVQTDIAVSADTSYRIRMELDDAGQLKVYVDDTLYIDHTQDISGLPLTLKPGLSVNSRGVTMFFDNLLVQWIPPNEEPVADAGEDQFVECQGELTAVQLDGSASSDPDGDDLTYEWCIAGVSLDDPNSATPVGQFPPGPTLATLIVTDGKGGFDTADVLITIQDTTPPAMICTTDLAVMWPPNHKMKEVEIQVAVTDLCSEPDDLVLTATVSSNESDDAKGDGRFTGDVDGLDGYTSPVPVDLTYNECLGAFVGTVQLRAERDGRRSGRTYSIGCEVMDLTGNTSTASCVVVIPHNKKRK
ncbi:MAG: hypothetical protein WBG04_12050 [Haloferula sp.]